MTSLLDDYWPSLIVSIVLHLAIGGLGGFSTAPEVKPGKWYSKLTKPPLNPPNKVFGPVWTILYILIAISSWMVYASQDGLSDPLIIYIIHLIFNAAWSPVFFSLHALLPALAIVCMMVGSSIWCCLAFYDMYPTAAYLLIPYICWISFATYLNLGIYVLNPQTSEGEYIRSVPEDSDEDDAVLRSSGVSSASISPRRSRI